MFILILILLMLMCSQFSKVLDHKYKEILQNISGRHIITEIGNPEKIVRIRKHGITNFFILANLKSIQQVLGAARMFFQPQALFPM